MSPQGKWDNWESQWLYIETANNSEHLCLLAGPILAWFEGLRQAGLTTTMVATDFFRRRLAPLQACPHLAWFYAGEDDTSRLTRGAGTSPDEAAIAGWLKSVSELFSGMDGKTNFLNDMHVKNSN